jgi:hypothetical protein
MTAVSREPLPQPNPNLNPDPVRRRWTWAGLEWWLAALLASRAGKVGVCTLGCLACAFRSLSLVALFLPR